MEIPVPVDQAAFFLKLLLNHVSRAHVSFDKAFKHVISKYGFPKHLYTTLYKLGYYTLTYYYTLRWLASKHGYGLSNAGIVNFFSSIGFSVRELARLAHDETRHLTPAKRISVLLGYPEYLVKDLLEKLSESEVTTMLSSLNERKRWLRVNILKTSIEKAVECLEESGVAYSRSEYSELAIRVDKPVWAPIARNKCIESSLLIPQDVSSVLSIEAIPVKPSIVLDACSAPGLKLSLLISLHKPLQAVGVDNSTKRISVEQMLLKKHGIDLSRTLLLNADASTVKFSRVFELAVVDAPCSGLGAVYSDPAVKLNSARRTKLEYYHKLQVSILENTLKHAEKVLYITCSIHPREGEEVVEEIAEKELAEPIPIKHKALSRAYPGYSISNTTYRLRPEIVNGQGFYIALLESRVAGKR